MRRSANTVGVVSVRLSKTLMRPLFSATNTRPSGEKRTAVGWVSPLKTISSWNPGGNDTADADSVVVNTASDDASNVRTAAKRPSNLSEPRPRLTAILSPG